MTPRCSLLPVVAIAWLAFAVSDAHAAAVRWTNAAGGNWSVTTNWSPAWVPTATDTVVIDLPGTYTVTCNGNYAVAGLRVNGAASGVQTMVASSRTLTFTGPVTIGAQGVVNLTTCTINGPGVITNEGTLIVSGATTFTATLATVPGSVVRVLANAPGTQSLTLPNGLTNNGTIELSSAVGGYAPTLTVTAGTLVNAVGASIQSLVGAGGSRTLAAALDNRGTVTVAGALSLTKSTAVHANSGTIDVTGGNMTVTLSGTGTSFTTTGAINVPASRTLTLTGTPFNYNGGTLGGAGTVNLTSATLNLNVPVGTVATKLDVNSSTVAGPATLTVQAGTTLSVAGSTLSGPTVVESGATLEFTGASTLSGALATVPGSVVRVLANAPGTQSLTLPNGLTNNGTIELSSAVGGYAPTLTVTAGTLVNAVGASIQSLVGAGGSRTLAAALDNRGTVTVAGALSLTKSTAVHANSGTIDVTGGNLAVTLSGTGTSFTTTGAINVPASRTLTLTGTPFNYNGGTLGGAGTVNLTSATLNLNVPVGTVATKLDVNSSTVAGPATLTVQAGTTLSAATSTLSGPVVVESGATLEFTGASTLSGALATVPGSVVRVLANAPGTQSLTLPNGLTNNGTIELSSAVGGYAPTLTVTAGTLVNAVGASIQSLVGAGGSRTLAAALDNRGTVTVAGALSITKAASAHLNTGTITVAAGKTLTVTGASFTNQPSGILAGDGMLAMGAGTSFAQNGSVRPGGSPGALGVNGPWPCAATSVFDVELAGETSGACDRIDVRDAATLDGAVNVTVLNGYQPRSNLRYLFARFASRTGTFVAVNGPSFGPGTMWAVEYTDTTAALMLLDQSWFSVKITSGSPPAREGHTAVYDSTSDRMIVFGGLTDTGVKNDVWVLAPVLRPNYAWSAWTQLAPTGTPPAPRTNASAVYDPISNRMMVYGGDDGAAVPAVMGDAWVLTHANGTGGTPEWLSLAPASRPPSRTAPAAAYDRVNNRLILFGGHATPAVCGGAMADVWVLANANGLGGAPAWTSLSPSGSAPSPRWRHGAGYDHASGRLIVTGGDDGCGAVNMETWLLSGANGLGGTPAWSMLVPQAPAPVGWSLARFTYDESYQWIDAFAGLVGGSYVDSTFTLTGASGGGGAGWHSRQSGNGRPSGRVSHSMIVHAPTHTGVMFGGRSASGRLNDVWRHEGTASRLLDAGPPVASPLPARTEFALPPSPNPARGDVAMTVDVARDQRVELAAFDLGGRRVATLHSGTLAAGRHVFHWTGGKGLAPGVYLVRLHAGDRDEVVRVVRLK